jgi:anthranilate synthase component 2
MIVLIDNSDSFTYTVFQLMAELGAEPVVVRAGDVDVAGIAAMEPTGIVISPGPGEPAGAGVSVPALLHFAAAGVPVFGICLGMQCIGAAYGGNVVRAGELVHGESTAVEHDGAGAFAGVPQQFQAVRYHSLAVDEATLPEELVVTARSVRRDGAGSIVMGLRHRTLPVEGVQFHPESILTEHGRTLIGNLVQHVSSATTALAGQEG